MNTMWWVEWEGLANGPHHRKLIEKPVGGYKFLVLLDAHPIPPSQLVEHRIDGQIFSGRRRAWRLFRGDSDSAPRKSMPPLGATFCFLAARGGDDRTGMREMATAS